MDKISVKSDWINITQSSINLLTYNRMRYEMTQRTPGKLMKLEEAGFLVL